MNFFKKAQEGKNSKKNRIFCGASCFAFVLFFFLLFLDFADQSMIGPLLNPLLLDFFGETSNVVAIGWISFAFTIVSALSMMAAGVFSDRHSRKKICFFGCLVYSLFSILTILIPHGDSGYSFFFLSRVMNGIGIGVIIPSIFSMVGDLVRPGQRSTAFGIISVSILAGRMLGFVLAGAFASQWRFAYFFVGIINFILAFGLFLIREPKRGAQENELKDIILEGAQYKFRITIKDIKYIWSNKSNFWLIANFIDVFPGAIIIFLIFKYLKDNHNMAGESLTFALLLVFFAGAAGALIFGRLGDWGFRKDRRAKAFIALICNVFPMVFMIFFLQSKFFIPEGANLSTALAIPGVWVLILTISGAMFINQGVNPNWYSCLMDTNLPEHRATMVSLASIMDLMGNALGLLFASIIATAYGIKTAMWMTLIFWILNAFLWLPVLHYIRKDLDNIHNKLSLRAKEMSEIISKG